MARFHCPSSSGPSKPLWSHSTKKAWRWEFLCVSPSQTQAQTHICANGRGGQSHSHLYCPCQPPVLSLGPVPTYSWVSSESCCCENSGLHGLMTTPNETRSSRMWGLGSVLERAGWHRARAQAASRLMLRACWPQLERAQHGSQHGPGALPGPAVGILPRRLHLRQEEQHPL